MTWHGITWACYAKLLCVVLCPAIPEYAVLCNIMPSYAVLFCWPHLSTRTASKTVTSMEAITRTTKIWATKSRLRHAAGGRHPPGCDETQELGVAMADRSTWRREWSLIRARPSNNDDYDDAMLCYDMDRLCQTALCCAMQCHAALCYTILYYTILYYTILYYTTLFYSIL